MESQSNRKSLLLPIHSRERKRFPYDMSAFSLSRQHCWIKEAPRYCKNWASPRQRKYVPSIHPNACALIQCANEEKAHREWSLQKKRDLWTSGLPIFQKAGVQWGWEELGPRDGYSQRGLTCCCCCWNSIPAAITALIKVKQFVSIFLNGQWHVDWLIHCHILSA